MEETRKVALAYYANCSDEFKQEARQFFNKIDVDRSGKISRYEYENYFEETSKTFNAKLFAELDYNGDGFLDFEESIVFFYMIYFRNFWCDNCGECLKSVYFTCSDCFMMEPCYDLCVTCYGSKNFKHEHQDFLDNHAVLFATRSALQDVEKERELQTEIVAVSNTESEDGGLRKRDVALKLCEVAVAAVSNTESEYDGLRKRDVALKLCERAVASQCSIM